VDFSSYPRGAPLNDLTTLNTKFNNFTLSASKAFVDGLFVSPTNQSNLTAQTRQVVGWGEVERQGLTGDKTLGIVSVCLSIGAVISFAVLTRLILVNQCAEFGLANLLPLLNPDKYESFIIV
jgi:hypothetical protein